MRAELLAEGSTVGERVGVEMREALGDIRGRQSETQISDQTAERGGFLVEFTDVLLLLFCEY